MPTPFKHAALIKQLADDNSLAVWYWHKYQTAWFSGIPDMLFDSDETLILALGEKPTQPPRKTCVLAGVEFPAPETEAPPIGTRCFRPDVIIGEGVAVEDLWGDCDTLRHSLENGFLHLTREAAEQHSRALLAANKQAIEGAR